ncbi:MAG: M20/M25/M40 family metallo-hydrolase, partial [Bacillota bacterium]|nr:M20/M25/M40 family metallo-hydrolase [Bacillota bacterium]
KPFCDLYLAFTVQEEIGLRGAVTATFGVEPDIAVAVDVTDTGDTPGAEPMAIKLGGGVAVKVKDGRMIASHEVRGLMESVCEENGIPYQLEILSGGTTDASVMQISRGGVKTGAVSVPTRYIHTVSETAAVSDIEATIKMLEKIVTRDEK